MRKCIFISRSSCQANVTTYRSKLGSKENAEQKKRQEAVWHSRKWLLQNQMPKTLIRLFIDIYLKIYQIKGKNLRKKNLLNPVTVEFRINDATY